MHIIFKLWIKKEHYILTESDLIGWSDDKFRTGQAMAGSMPQALAKGLSLFNKPCFIISVHLASLTHLWNVSFSDISEA